MRLTMPPLYSRRTEKPTGGAEALQLALLAEADEGDTTYAVRDCLPSNTGDVSPVAAVGTAC